MINQLFLVSRGGIKVRSRLRCQRAPGSKPDSTADPPCMGPVTSQAKPSQAKPYAVAKRPHGGAMRKFEERMPAQASSSPSGRCSKLRGPSQNTSRAASKQDVIKLS
ncbi:hypothetical protein AVEN_26244-1 [Araneus ventricosus]|uniref:Uncharacterized protein n=1 Tax=Araneus ventricosus TaxID=182803 RepID=A0A4Y2ALS9_ARAVE|nr:hypothetical protein AVEN_26244-1 [Araneus ventricosus]